MLPDRAIVEMIWPSQLHVTPTVFVPKQKAVEFGDITHDQVQPASLDVRLNSEIVLHKTGERIYMGHDVSNGDGWMLMPGDCILGSLLERLDMRADNVAARIEGKSTWARKFLTVHSAGFIDPGFAGDITLELKNDGQLPIWLFPGVRIAQISFHFLSAPASRLYGEKELNSHYQGQMGTTEAWT